MSLRFVTIIAWLVFASLACGPNQRILESSNANAPSPDGTPAANAAIAPIAPATFEQDLEAMRTADFKFILVFRRKDGQPLDDADKEWVTRNVGPQVNRRRLSDGGKAILIGGNFPLLPIDDLPKSLTMEKFEKPGSGPMFSNSISNN